MDALLVGPSGARQSEVLRETLDYLDVQITRSAAKASRATGSMQTRRQRLTSAPASIGPVIAIPRDQSRAWPFHV